MIESSNPLPPELASDPLLQRIDRALKAAVRDALARHKREGNPVAICRDAVVIPRT
jgi:hypothetical protein